MRILHYNILDGCLNEPARLAAIQSWIAGQRLDIAALNECNTWNEPPGITAHAEACGFRHGHLLVGHSDYLIAVLAKAPVEVLDEITTTVHHGILHVRAAGVHIITSHWAPVEREMRMHEARTLAALAVTITEPLVVMGDFNSASPIDAAALGHIREGRDHWAADFEAQQILHGIGLRDLAARSPDHRGTLNPTYHPNHGHRWMDYIYINDAFHRRHQQAQVTCIRNESTGHLSDHLPLILDTH